MGPASVSERDAAALLDDNRTQARRALQCGLAGPIGRTRSRLQYDREAVEALAEWPLLDVDEFVRGGHTGVLVIRVPPGLPADLVRDPDRLRAWAEGPWVTAWKLVPLLEVGLHHGLPTVVVVSRYVHSAYTTTRINAGTGGIRLTLDPPGDWAAAALHHQWPLGRGGRTFRFLYLGHYPHWFA